jgi:hypothetical protein
MDKIAWRWISYDVWGNQEDGWDVNAAYPTSVVYRLPPEADDKTILRTIFEEDADKIEIETYSSNDTIYFVCKDYGQPLGEIRRLES